MVIEKVLCAEAIIVDQFTNKLSLINLLENVAAAGFPFVFPNLSALISIRREDGENESPDAEIVVSISEVELAKAPLNVNFQGANYTRSIFNMAGVLIEGPGEISLVARVGGAEAVTWRCPIISALRAESHVAPAS